MKRRTRSVIVQELRKKLQIAIELEHATIPVYLYAYWSVKDHESPIAASIIEVAKEEMNHMAMACNIMNAVGGFVNCANQKFIPSYPTGLPGHNETFDSFKVSLGKLSIDSIITFLQIELPRDPAMDSELGKGWTTIADFYLDVLKDIDELDDEDFSHGRQLNDSDSPDAAGILFSVTNKRTAKLCIAEIIEQGEGLRNENKLISKVVNMKSHYERFLKVYHDMGGYGEVDQNNFNREELTQKVDQDKYQAFMKNVHNMVTNPANSSITNKHYKRENLKFNSLYSHMLDNMHTHVHKKHPDMSAAIRTMFALGRHAAALRSIQLDNGEVGGPSFEYIPIKERR